jgi:uncharacterized membrane protein
MNADLGRFFGVALIVAVIYFVGQILFVAVPVSGTGNVQRAIYLLFFIINLPAVPFRLLFPSASPDVSLAVACFGWGAVFYLGGVLRRRISARRLTRA